MRKSSRGLLTAIVLTLAALLSGALPCSADLFKWVDDRGRMHFTDNLYNVPEEYRRQIKTYDELPAPSVRARVDLDRTSMGYMVEVKVNSRVTATLILDTGATTTTLNRSVLKRAGAKIESNPPVILQTANGQTRAGWAEVESLAVGDHVQRYVRVVAHDAVEGVDGLLGMNFLSNYKMELNADLPALMLYPK